jgi:uncharacterized membrane protein
VAQELKSPQPKNTLYNWEGMSALQDYLKKVERNLVGLEDKEKRRVLKDIEIQIIKLSEEHGGGEEGIKKAIEEIGPAEKIVEKYSDMYSLGFQDYLIISGIALFLASFGLPILPFMNVQNVFSLIIVLILTLFIAFVGINWGVKAALVPGLLSAIWRSSIFQITLWMYPFEIKSTFNGTLVVHLTSLLLVIICFAFPWPGKE